MRTYYSLHPFQNNTLPECTETTRASEERCTYSSPVIPSSSLTTIFLNCDFRGCIRGGNGGAIYFSQSAASLSINRCSFKSCNCGRYTGGAIYVISLSLLSIKNSVFDSCGGSHQSESGGALAFNSVPSLTICDNIFLQCYSAENSGAVDMRSSGNNQKEIPIQFCSFIHCECLYGGSPSAGALEGSGNSCGYFSSVLCFACKSDYGGALWLDPPFVRNSICFSFFTENRGNASLGNDIAVRYFPDSVGSAFFLHSFTTTTENRLASITDNLRTTTINQNWLPKGTVRYLNLGKRTINLDRHKHIH